MSAFPHLPLQLRRGCDRNAVSLLGGVKVGRFLRPGSWFKRWLRSKVRAGLYVRAVPHESAVVREPRYYVTHWVPLCGHTLRRDR